ncbi:MAG: pre-peptidase C-terminal domain-containing protein, partial [Polyangiaceae bacterium]
SGGAPGVCGNTIRDGNEECDGSDFGGITCFKLGYDGGTLKCASCKFDKSACTGTENCYDGKDNDGDGNADCADSECSAQCADSCSMTAVLADPNSASGDTTGHASKIANSCSASSGGPEVVYEFHAKYTGVLEVALLPYAALTASVRTSCATSATELGCIAGGRIKLASTANQTYYIVVDGDDANSAGAYAISAETRVITCGDGNRDGNEECDDGGKTPNDGCSATCTLESDEVEPNGTSAQASTYKADYTAAIDPAGDVDVIKFVMPAGKTAMKLDTFDLGDGACAKEELDSVLELLDSNGTTVLYTDDDGGQGTCAQINATGLTPGKTYYVRVTASTVGDVTTFPYRLAIQTS